MQVMTAEKEVELTGLLEAKGAGDPVGAEEQDVTGLRVWVAAHRKWEVKC